MRICIFGAGAIGGLLGVRLALAGHDVSFLARGEHLAAIRAKGATLVSNGEVVTVHPPASDRPADLGPQDVVILAVKATAAATAAKTAAPLLGPETAVVTAMNGIPYWYFYRLPGRFENHRLASVDPDGAQWDGLPPARAVGCVVYAAGAIEAPGVIRHISGSRFVLGEPDGSDSARVRRIADAFTTAGFDAPVSRDIRTAIWIKLWGNLSFNPVSVLTGGTLDVLATDDDSRRVIAAMMEESRAVAHRLGIDMGMDVETRLRMAAQVGAHKTSMLQDFERGRPLELDALLGAVVEMARLVGVATPMCEAVLGLARQRARLAAGPA